MIWGVPPWLRTTPPYIYIYTYNNHITYSSFSSSFLSSSYLSSSCVPQVWFVKTDVKLTQNHIKLGKLTVELALPNKDLWQKNRIQNGHQETVGKHIISLSLFIRIVLDIYDILQYMRYKQNITSASSNIFKPLLIGSSVSFPFIATNKNNSQQGEWQH